MKTKLFLLFVATYFVKSMSASSLPSSDCDSIKLVKMELEYFTKRGQAPVINITVLNDKKTPHINYPFVSCVINSQGDTIAKGKLDAFVHFSGKTETYTTRFAGRFTLLNDTYTIVFKYDNDSCLFNYIYTETQPLCDSLLLLGFGFNDTEDSLMLHLYNGKNSLIMEPYISYVLDSKGDTVSKGFLESFGLWRKSPGIFYAHGIFSKNESYSVVFKYNADSCVIQLNKTMTGVNKNEQPASSLYFDIYPNPSQGSITVTTTGKMPFNVTIYNLNGQYVWQEKMIVSQKVLDINMLTKGIYLIVFQDDNALFFSKKLVVN